MRREAIAWGMPDVPVLPLLVARFKLSEGFEICRVSRCLAEPVALWSFRFRTNTHMISPAVGSTGCEYLTRRIRHSRAPHFPGSTG